MIWLWKDGTQHVKNAYFTFIISECRWSNMADADSENLPAAEATSGEAQEQVSAADSAVEESPVQTSIQSDVAQEDGHQDGNDAQASLDAETGSSAVGDGDTEGAHNDDPGEAAADEVHAESESDAAAGANVTEEPGVPVDDADAERKAAAARQIQRVGRGRIIRKQDRAALAASSTVTKDEAREERQRQLAERKENAKQTSEASSHAHSATVAEATPTPQVETKKAATLDDVIDLGPFQAKPELGEWNRDLVSLEHAVTFDVVRRGNLKMIDENTALSVCGSRLLILDITTMSQRFFPTVSGRGVGCVAVHPNRTVFAVGEKGVHPFIVVYTWPDCQPRKILRGGTERAFSDMVFSPDGASLASVGSYPDYLLHVWNWMEESVVLRAKAFSQEVYKVEFSPRNPGILYTSGTGHIRFWKMARTFTGLKLQGDIGRFGNVELSDISCFVELPDGKVLSGSESGNLLLWDGNLVKVEISRRNQGNCHLGMVESLWLENGPSGETVVASAGADGYIRHWPFEQIDQAQPEEGRPAASIDCLQEFCVAVGSRVRDLYRGTNRWLIQDDGGALWSMDPQTKVSSPLLAVHAGAVVSVLTSPIENICVSCGVDGTVRVVDLKSSRRAASQLFNSPCSCMLWAPSEIDSQQRTLLIGFADGVVRVVTLEGDGDSIKHVALKHAFKPHSAAIVAMKLTPSADRLVTACKDGSVFFLTRSEGFNFTPICFVQLPSPPTTAVWNADGMSVILGCKDSCLYRVHAPGADGSHPVTQQPIDVTSTFKATLPIDTHAFAVEPPARPAAPAKEKAEGESDDDNEEEAQAVVAPVKQVFGEVTALLLSSQDRFFVTLNGPDACGAAWEVEFGTTYPIRYVQTHGLASADAAPGSVKSKNCFGEHLATVFLTLSHDGKVFVSGSADGAVRLRTVDVSGSKWLFNESNSLQIFSHDIDTGRISGAALTLDCCQLVTAAFDGQIFVHSVAPDFHKLQSKSSAALAMLAEEAKAAAARAAAIAVVDDTAAASAGPGKGDSSEPLPGDIIDPKHYSIEEEKLKAEADRHAAEVVLKKQAMQARIMQLRAEFEEIVSANARLPPAEQLPRDSFNVDPQLRSLLEEQVAKKVELTRKELAWTTEKKALQLKKLRAYFLDDVAVERIVLHAFKTNHRVSSFRTRKLTAQQLANIEAVRAFMANEESKTMTRGAGKSGARGIGTASSAGGDRATTANSSRPPATAGEQGMSENGGDVSGTASGMQELSKEEIRIRERAERKKRWEQLLARKPDADFQDPENMARIEKAEKNMGDYKLKSDVGYIVPDHLRINAMKKRRQLVLLEDSVYSVRMGFNERFLALRDLKRRIISNIQQDNVRLQAINNELACNEPLWQPKLLDDEMPERREEISEQDLLEFEVKQAAQEAAASSKGKGGFGDFGGGASSGSSGPAKTESQSNQSSTSATASTMSSSAAGSATSDLSELEQAELSARRLKLEFEKRKILEKINRTVSAFDSALVNLLRERFKLEVDLKTTDLRLLLLYQELKLLKEFEKRDQALAQKLEAKCLEKAEVVSRIAECQERLANKKADIERLNPKQLFGQLQAIVPETHKHAEDLFRIFKKKIKRAKKAAAGEEEVEDDEELSDFDDLDDEEDEEFCPPGCDPALYEQVCELREKRLDQEDVLADLLKTVEALKKDHEALIKKERVIDAALNASESEIRDFQSHKQQELNKLDTVVALKMHQVISADVSRDNPRIMNL
jgi:WD40 repeat protein